MLDAAQLVFATASSAARVRAYARGPGGPGEVKGGVGWAGAWGWGGGEVVVGGVKCVEAVEDLVVSLKRVRFFPAP